METHLRTPATCRQIPSTLQPRSAAARKTEPGGTSAKLPHQTTAHSPPSTIKCDMADTLELATKHVQPLMGIDESLGESVGTLIMQNAQVL